MKNRSKYWLVAAMTAGALALAGCAPTAETPTTDPTSTEAADPSAPSAELIAAAQAEGTLTYFNDFPPAINDQIVAKFQEAYGIQIQYLALNSALLIERFSAEASANALSADVVSMAQSADFFQDALDNGWTEELTAADLPAMADYPEEFKQGDTSATVAFGAFLILYNEDKLDEDLVPATFEDLTDPKYKDQLVIVDPTTNNAFVGFYDALRTAYGDEWFEKVLKNNPKFYPAASAGAQAMMAGEGLLMTPALGAVAQALKDSGAPVGTVLPPITTGPQFNLVLTDESIAPHPNAAKLFANWMLSEQGNLTATGDLILSPFDTTNTPEGYIQMERVTPKMKKEILALLKIS